MTSSTRMRGERTSSARLLRGCGQERGQEHHEAESQPQQLGGNNRHHNVTHTPLHEKPPKFSVVSSASGSRFLPSRDENCFRAKLIPGQVA
jgi:hypothetical protein